MIDIGHGYTLKMAMQAAREFEQLGIYWMEEPLPPDDFEDYRRLCTRPRCALLRVSRTLDVGSSVVSSGTAGWM